MDRSRTPLPLALLLAVLTWGGPVPAAELLSWASLPDSVSLDVGPGDSPASELLVVTDSFDNGALLELLVAQDLSSPGSLGSLVLDPADGRGLVLSIGGASDPESISVDARIVYSTAGADLSGFGNQLVIDLGGTPQGVFSADLMMFDADGDLFETSFVPLAPDTWAATIATPGAFDLERSVDLTFSFLLGAQSPAEVVIDSVQLVPEPSTGLLLGLGLIGLAVRRRRAL